MLLKSTCIPIPWKFERKSGWMILVCLVGITADMELTRTQMFTDSARGEAVVVHNDRDSKQ